MIGRILNQKWEVGAKHALFHKDGSWYHKLKRFPGAYFDSAGYILFNTEEEYELSPYLSIGKTVHIKPSGIRYIPGYKEMDEEPLFKTYSNGKLTLWKRFKLFLSRIYRR